MHLGDNLLSFQRDNGGFPKSKDFEAKLGRAEFLRNFFDRHRRDTTLDNGATHTQIRDLARVYTLTELPRFRHGCERGIECLLVTQYDNGGWPQRFPEPRGYARYITFNDHAMVGALSVLHDVARGEDGPFGVLWACDRYRDGYGSMRVPERLRRPPRGFAVADPPHGAPGKTQEMEADPSIAATVARGIDDWDALGSDVLCEALAVLAAHGAAEHFEVFRWYLAHPDDAVRYLAVESVVESGHPRRA